VPVQALLAGNLGDLLERALRPGVYIAKLLEDPEFKAHFKETFKLESLLS
jgi:hypothetical protein